MATKVMIASVRLQADASQYTAEYLKAGRVVEDFSARVAASTEAASNSTKKLGDELKKIPAELIPALTPVVPKLDEIPTALNKTTISAKQTAAALRGVPAQFTDIITSLQGGQSPLTVFIQQGGQLKDMFGGAGNAARAMSGYVAGLVTVTTVASTVIGGAVVGLALAYNQGSKEADAYVRAIVMSGNAAGTTAGQMQASAATVAAATAATKGASSEALAALVSDGNTAAAMLERAAGTAIVLQRDAGIAVSETVKRFSELGKEPVAASIKLNEQYHYLTTAVYEQIKALDEQGKKEEAAALAQKTFSEAMDYRAGQLRANLGAIERAWGGVTSAAGKAWDAMLDVGRTSSKIDELATVRKQIAANEEQIARGAGGEGMPGIGLIIREATAALKDQNTQLRAKEAALAGVVAGQKANADQEAASAKETAALIAWNKEGEKYLSKKAQMEREITAARNEATAAGLKGAVVEQRIAEIREKYKEKGGATSAGQSELANLRARTLAEQQYVDQLKAHGEQAVKVSEGDKLVLQYQEQLKGKLDAKTRSAKEALLVEAQNLAAVQKVRDVEVERQKALAASTAAHNKLIEATGKAADSIQEQAEKQEAANAVLGKGKTAIEQMTLATLKHQLQEAEGSDNFDPKYIASLNAKIAAQSRFVAALNGADFKALINKEQEWLDQAKERAALYEDEKQLAGLTNLERAKIVATRQVELRLAKELALIDKSDLSETQKEDARRKAREAKEIDSSAAVNKVVQDDWTKTTDQINQSLTDALMTGGKDGADYIEGLFRTMVLRPLISAVMTPVSNLVNQGMNAVGLGGGSSGGVSLTNPFGGGGSIASILGNGISSLGTAFGSSAFSAFGAGMASAAGEAALGAAFVGPGAAAAGGAVGLGATIGAAIPYIGLALAAVSLLSGMGKGESRSGGQYGVAFDGAVTNNRRGETYTEVGQQYNRNNSTGVKVTDGKAYLIEADGIGANDAKIKEALASTAAGINSMLKGMGSSAALAQFFGGFENSSKGRGGVFSGGKFEDGTTFGESGQGDNYAGTLYEKFSTNSPDLETAIANFSQDLLQSSIQALQKVADAPETIKKKVKDVDAESLSTEEAQALLTDIGNTIAGVENFRAAVKLLPFDNLRDMSFDAAAGLIELSGGIDSLGSKLGSYYNNFYSESERQAIALKNVQKSMADLGHGDVDTQAEFRALWESADPKTEAGAKLIAQLLEIESAFAAVYPAASDAAAGAEVVAATLAETIAKLRNPTRSIDDIAKNTVGLEDKAWELENEGNTAALRERQTKGWTDAEKAIQAHIWALEGEKTAAAEAAQQAATIANERKSLERQLLELNGDTVALRALERAEVEEANLAFYDLVKARQDEIAAAAEAARQAETIANERKSLERQLLELNGDTVALRALERAEVEEANLAFYDIVKARQDEIAAAAEAARQAETVANERKSLERQLLELNGDTAALRALERAEVEEVNLAFYDLVKARQDEIAAAAEAARQAETIANERKSLERQLLELNGDTAALRALDRAEIEEANRALFDHVRAVEDQKKAAADAASAATQAASEQAAAAAQIKDLWGGISDSLIDEMKRVRGELTGGGKQGQAYAQAQFDAATARALSGDQEAAKQIPALNKAVLEFAAKTASTELDLRQVQAAQLASMAATNAILAAKYGLNVPAFATGGEHLGGLRIVGERGPELEATGRSRIYTAAQTRAFLNGGGSDSSNNNNAEVAAELRAVRSLLAQLLGTSKEGAGYMKDLDHNFARVSRRGPYLATMEVTP